MPTKAFLSYSRSDASSALEIARRARAAGIDLWVDQLDIPPGVLWDTAIESALKGATHVVFLLSPDAVESHNVLDEMSFALESRKSIVPVLMRPCDRPFRIRRYQYIDATAGMEAAIDQLVARLQWETSPEAALPQTTEPPGAKPTPAHCDLTPTGSANPTPPRRGLARTGMVFLVIVIGVGSIVILAMKRPSPPAEPPAAAIAVPATATAADAAARDCPTISSIDAKRGKVRRDCDKAP